MALVMRGWAPFFVAALACLAVFGAHRSFPGMLQDSDTAEILKAIQTRQNPWSWFGGDWPLANHFYRPVSTLSFELDHALYGGDAAGYARTNALLAALCIGLLYAFLRELTEKPWLAALGAWIFALWHLPLGAELGRALLWLAIPTVIVGWMRHGWSGRAYLGAAALWIGMGYELSERVALGPRILAWLPGRTASVMSVFALLALMAYARYERLGAGRLPKPPSPLDPPATKSTRQTVRGASALWPVLAALATAFALGSYEQAVMLPALLLGVALSFRMRGVRPRWGWQALFWGLLAGYLVFRSQILPAEVSTYQEQQLRQGLTVLLDLSRYAFPWALALSSIWIDLSLGWISLLTPGLWSAVLRFGGGALAYVQLRKEAALAFTGWALSILAFLPMAWLKPFDHYHYLPMAMRSLFVAVGLTLAVRMTLSAASPPTRQAPPRRDPAPGSLPHP